MDRPFYWLFTEFYIAILKLIINRMFSWWRKIKSKLRSSKREREREIASHVVGQLVGGVTVQAWPVLRLIRTNQILQIVTAYQYRHQNTSYTSPNHLLQTHLIVLRSPKSMSNLTMRNIEDKPAQACQPRCRWGVSLIICIILMHSVVFATQILPIFAINSIHLSLVGYSLDNVFQ